MRAQVRSSLSREWSFFFKKKLFAFKKKADTAQPI